MWFEPRLELYWNMNFERSFRYEKQLLDSGLNWSSIQLEPFKRIGWEYEPQMSPNENGTVVRFSEYQKFSSMPHDFWLESKKKRKKNLKEEVTVFSKFLIFARQTRNITFCSVKIESLWFDIAFDDPQSQHEWIFYYEKVFHTYFRTFGVLQITAK